MPSSIGRSHVMYLIIDFCVILLAGFSASRLASRVGLPGLVGMIGIGILIGPEFGDILSPAIYSLSTEIRLLALVVILLRAGLGLDKDKLLSQGSVALRLTIIPVLMEASILALSTRLLLGWEWLYCWILGWIVCAASPAVIVPSMLQLKSEGRGVRHGIPDLVLSEATVSDATAITMFGITLAWLTDGHSNILLQMTEIPIQIAGGLAVGYVSGRVLRYLLRGTTLTSTAMQDMIVTLGFGLAIIWGSNYLPYSEYLGIMVMGFTLLELDPVIARELRRQSADLWAISEVFLFVLIGATVSIGSLSRVGLTGAVIVIIGVMVGKALGIFLSTAGSSLTVEERVFMVVGGMAKATVQAAIAGIPLAMGLPLGEEILAISFVAIIVTAPLGSWGTSYLAPKLLAKGEVDPTKVTVERDLHFLVAVDGSGAAENALKKAASAARDNGAFVSILHVTAADDLAAFYSSIAVPDHFARDYRRIVSDVPHEFLTIRGTAAQGIVETAHRMDVDYIYMGKANRRSLDRILIGNTAKEVIEHTEIPVILVDRGNGDEQVQKDQ